MHTNNPVNPVKKERRDASITRYFHATRQIRPLLFATPCATNRIFIGKTAKVGVLGQVLNIAEGNGKMAEADRRRYFEIARGAVLECGAIQDVLVVGKALDEQESLVRKTELDRMAAMLSRLGGQGCCVAENSVPYGTKPEKVDPDPGPDFDFEKEKPQQGGHPTRIRAGWPLSFWRGTSGHDFSTTSRTA